MSASLMVIGGGLAGITAALTLADAGQPVTLVESRGRLGGATWSVRRDGLTVDNGQHVFLRACSAYRGLLDRLGVGERTVLQDRLDIPVLRPGGPTARLRRARLPVPLHLAGALLSYRHVPPRERLAAGRATRALGRLNLADPDLDRLSFGEFLARRGQSSAAVEALWDVLVTATLNLPGHEASLAAAAFVVQRGLLSEPGAADLGWSTVPLDDLHAGPAAAALAAAGVTVRLGERVTGLHVDAAGIDVVTPRGVERAEGVVLAVPPTVAADLLPAGVAGDARRFRRLGRSPILNLHVHYDRRVTDLPFAAGVGTPVQWVFDRTESSGARSGQVLSVSLSAATAYDGVPAGTVRAQLLPALARLFPAASQATVRAAVVIREPAATIRPVPGSAALRPPATTSRPDLTLAGAWTDTGWPVTMESAVRSGTAAAVHLLAGRAARVPAGAS